MPDPITKLLQKDWVHTAQPIMERLEIHLVMLQASASTQARTSVLLVMQVQL